MGTVESGFFTNNDIGTFIGFEEYPDGFGMITANIPGIIFDQYWRVGDFTTGDYNGKWPYGRYNCDGWKFCWRGQRIDFPFGAIRVSFISSNEVGISVEAYDQHNNLIDRAPLTGASNPTYNPDDSGSMDKFTVNGNIHYILINGSYNLFLIDDIVVFAQTCIIKRDEGVYSRDRYCYVGEGIVTKR